MHAQTIIIMGCGVRILTVAALMNSQLPSIFHEIVECIERISVNNSVDKVLALEPIADVEKIAKKFSGAVRETRILTMYLVSEFLGEDDPRDQVKTKEILKSWKTKPRTSLSYRELIQIVSDVAVNNQFDTARFEQTKLDPNIYEFKDENGKPARLFAFFDGNGQVIVICGHYLKHGQSDVKERPIQNDAIQKASDYRKLWVNAQKDKKYSHIRVIF